MSEIADLLARLKLPVESPHFPADTEGWIQSRKDSQSPIHVETQAPNSFPKDENELRNLLRWLYQFTDSPRVARALEAYPAGRRIKEIVSGRE